MPDRNSVVDVLASFSRRDFLKLASAAALLAGCGSRQVAAIVPTGESASPPTLTKAPSLSAATAEPLTATALPTATSAPTREPTVVLAPSETVKPAPSEPTPDIPEPTAEPTRPSRAEVTAIYPQANSRVVRVHRADVMSADLTTVSQGAVESMLDAAIAKLTGIQEVAEAWRLLFDPDERIAIKVSTIAGSRFWTHPQLVQAVVRRLGEAGIPEAQIVIFDRETRELEDAGYPANKGSSGVGCYGTDGRYSPGWRMMDTDVALSDVLLACDALINMPVLKTHSIAGISFAMKNHYGTFDRPGSFHGTRVVRGLAELNALEPIRQKTRLLIGDALTICTRNWNSAVAGNMLLASFDPVAIDAVALETFGQAVKEHGGNASAPKISQGWLSNGAELGLGTLQGEHIDLTEVDLS